MVQKKVLAGVIIILIFILGVIVYGFMRTGKVKEVPTPIVQDFSETKLTTLEDWKKKYNVKEFVFEANPQDLPPNFPHPGRTVQEDVAFPEDAWYIGFVPDQLGAVHALHHADVIDLSRPNYFCKNQMPNVITATGEELTPGFLPLGYGYEVKKNSKIVASLMYHNEDVTPLSGVRAKLTFYYIPKNKANLTQAMPFFLDVIGPCLWGEYFLSPMSTHTKQMKPEYVVEKPGRIILMGIHMHHYAKSFEVLLNGKTVKKFELADTEEGKPLLLPKYAPKYLYVQKGDRLGIRAVYNNTTDQKLDAMAEMLFYMVPDEGRP